MYVQTNIQRNADPAIAPAAGGAGLETAATPAAKPMTTETVQADLRSYLLASPPANAEPATPAAAEPAPTTPPTGTEPSPDGQSADATALNDDSEDPDPPNGEPIPRYAIDQITKLRAQKRQLKEKLETAAKQFEAELAKLKGATPPAAGADDPSKRSEPANADAEPAEDRLAAVPLVKAAREEKAKHDAIFNTSSDLLTKLGRDFRGLDDVVSTLKEVHNMDFEGKQPEDVEAFLLKCRDTALLNRSDASAHLTALEREAERNLGAAAEQWSAHAKELMPELNDPASAESQEAAKVFQHFPALKRDPRALRLAAAIIEGNKVLEARARHKAQPKAPASPAAARPGGQLPGAAASLPASQPSVSGYDAAYAAYLKNPNEETRKAWIMASGLIVARAA